MKELKVEFKPKFVERYSALTDWETFKDASLKFQKRSLRVNRIKSTVKEVKDRLYEKGWRLTQVPWCEEAFFVDHIEGRRDIGNAIEHFLGYFYIQEASSMIPPIVLSPRPGDIVLDMCASPGSKTTQMADMMENQGILISNDYKIARMAPLSINVQKAGITNQMITLGAGQNFKGIMFDRILVDAPCSGTGTIQKSLKTLRIWNPGMIKRLAHTQKKLVENAYSILKPGGEMVYSTCSLEPQEDEGVVSYIVKKYPDLEVQKVEVPGLKTSETVKEFDGEVFDEQTKNCLRIWPQDNQTGGFFVTKFKKKNN